MRVFSLTILALALFAAPVQAQTTTSTATPAPAKAGRGFSLNLGFDAAGPLVFRDTPDQTLSTTRVFAFGMRIAFLSGDETVHDVRFGGGIGFSSIARSAHRRLSAVDPQLLVSLGFPFELQVGFGARIGAGTEGFRENYGGMLWTAALRYHLQGPNPAPKLTVTPSLFGQFILNPKSAAWSSAFVGVRVEVAFHKRAS